MSTDLNHAVHRLRQDCYPNDQDGRDARQADIEHLSHALGLAEDTTDRLVGELAKEVNGPTFMGEPALPHPDDAAVDRFARALKLKLAAARDKGRGGWSNDEPDMQQRLSDMLRAHVAKGDPRDVANFCMFLHQRGEGILPTRSQNQVEVLPGRYFAADPAMGDFDLYATLADARTNAQRMLDEATDEAADGGWPDDPPQICYGIVLSECVETDRKPAPTGSEFDEIVTYELTPTAHPETVGQSRPAMQFTLRQAEQLLEVFGGENTDITVEYFPAGHWPDHPDVPAGLYAYCTDYPGEGAFWLGEENASEDIRPTWQRIPPPDPAPPPEAILDHAVHAYKVASVARMAMQTDPGGTPTIACLDASIRQGVAAALLAVRSNPPAQAAQVDSANWFAGKHPAAVRSAEPVAQGEAVTGTFDCPICGSVEVHYHSASEACAWAAAQANRFLISLGHPEIVMRTKDEDERRTTDFRKRVADVEEMLRDAGHSYQSEYARLSAQPRAVPDEAMAVLRDLNRAIGTNASGAGIDHDKRPTDYKAGMVKAYEHCLDLVRSRITARAALNRTAAPSPGESQS